MNGDAPGWHRIKSFVRREGRLTAGQARAMESLWPRFGIDYEERPLDISTRYGRSAPLVLEIGFGNGDSLAQMAQQQPDVDFLGIEVHRPGVGHLLQRIEEMSLNNLRVSQHDAVEVLAQQIPKSSLSGVQVFFPDPWHKKRHHKRRLIQHDFLTTLAGYLKPGGFVHCATDWAEYAEHMRATFEAHPDFILADDSLQESCRSRRPETKFERRGLRLGHGVWDMVYVKS